MFDRVRSLYGMSSRWVQGRARQAQDQINLHNHLCVFEARETLFRNRASFGRPENGLLLEPTTGPFVVVEGRILRSVVPRGPETQQLVDDGASLPVCT
jgi:hypothetical protein